MRIVAISDTHGQHEKLDLPGGDLLIHAGDISGRGEEQEVENFLLWVAKQNFAHKLFIAGNHDFYFERETEAEIRIKIPKEIIYLKDEGATINGLKFWGSPVTPWFFDWAFNRRRGHEIARHWEMIEVDTDILVTHGPMFRRLDRNSKGEHVGCKDLLLRSKELKLKTHIFGHIHEAYGTMESDGIKFINASVVNERYELINEPIVIDL